MPNIMSHAVWNLSPTVALGDNPLYESSFPEFIGSGKPEWYKERILFKSKGTKKCNLMNIVNQIEESVKKHKITDYNKLIDIYKENGY